MTRSHIQSILITLSPYNCFILFVYHLNDKSMPDETQGTASTIHNSSEQLRLFAFEAEVNENYEMAAVYYEEVAKYLSDDCCYL